MTVPDDAGRLILERWTSAGVLEVPAGADPETILLQGLQRRHDGLVRFLTQYREQQAINRASGVPIQLPREHHQKAMKEIDELAAEIAERDPVMRRQLPGLAPSTQVDPVMAEAARFGVAPEPVPQGATVDIGF